MFLLMRHYQWVSLLVLLISLPVSAEMWTWDNGAGDGLWSNITNWEGDASAPVSDPGTDLIIGGSTPGTITNDLGSFQFNDMILASSSFMFMDGDELEVFNSIFVSNSTSHILYNDVTLGADATFGAEGTLVMGGVVDNAGHTLRTEGPATVGLSGLTGSGGLNVYGPGMTQLVGSNSYSGATHVYGGTLETYIATNTLRSTSGLTVEGASTANVHSLSGLFAPDVENKLASVTGSTASLVMWGLPIEGTSNTVLISGGAQAAGTACFMGSGTGNAIIVSGPGSTFDHTASGFIASSTGTGHRLWATDGGQFDLLNAQLQAPHMDVLISGTGSEFNCQGFSAEATAENLKVELNNGGQFASLNNVSLYGSGSTVLVHGAGSRWDAAGLIMEAGADNSYIAISNSGRLAVDALGVRGSSNMVVVEGLATVLGNANGMLYVDGTNNAIRINDGVTCNLLPAFGGRQNTIVIEGSGSSMAGLAAGGMSGIENQLIVSNGARMAISSFTLSGLSNRISVDGAGTVFSNRGQFIAAGATGCALQVTGGAELRTDDLFFYSTKDSQILVDGAGSLLMANEITALMTGTVGGIVVTNGSEIMSDEATLAGSVPVIITGAGSKWQNPGLFETYTETHVDNGGRLDTGEVIIDGSGLLLVEDAGSVWSNSGQITVGAMDDNNRITVRDGAKAWSESLTVGLSSSTASNTVTVTGPGTTWNVQGQVAIGGDSAFNRLLVIDQSSMTVDDLMIGSSLNASNNRVAVKSDASLFATSISVGGANGDHNELRVRGGHVTADSVEILANGRVWIDEGSLTVNSLSKTSELNGSLFDFDGGTLNVSSSEYHSLTPFEVGDGTQTAELHLTGSSSNQHRFNGGLIINPNATLSGEGTVLDDIAFSGTLDPGDSAGTLVFEGEVTLDSGTETFIEIFGEGDGEYDRVEVASITYDGLLDVSFSGFAVTNGTRIQIFDAGSYSGSFTTTNFSGVGSAGFDAASGEVFVITAIPEATTCALLGIGFLLLWTRKRRR